MPSGKENKRMQYNFKIKWLFPVSDQLFKNKKAYTKELYSVVRALGASSLDCIKLLDSDGKLIDKHVNKIIMPFDKSNEKTIRYLKKKLKNPNVYYVELIRK